MSDQIKLKELPPQDAPGYFRLLVRNCIETYKELPNDAMCLDYNRVSGKLRALVLDDEEYKQETRNIYAKQRLEELYEIDSLAKLALNEEEDGEESDPRSKGKNKKISGADKDMLNMRFKAAQMRRELISAMNEDNNASERDAVNLMFVGMSRKEIEKSAHDEIYEGGDDGALDELTSPKEEAPEGTSGKVRLRGQDKPLEDEDDDDPRARGRKKKTSGADKDMLNMRFKAAQMRRELIASLNGDNNAFERDAASFMFVPISEAEFREARTDEVYGGDDDGALDELADRKEKAPEGTEGKARIRGGTKPLEDGDFFEVLPDGGIVEK
jgi:hypothetical protein